MQLNHDNATEVAQSARGELRQLEIAIAAVPYYIDALAKIRKSLRGDRTRIRNQIRNLECILKSSDSTEGQRRIANVHIQSCRLIESGISAALGEPQMVMS